MQLIETAIPDVKIIVAKKHGDHRGFFSETFSRRSLRDLLRIDIDFVQDNHSLSAEKGVVRGLHYQLHPMAQDKLIRVVRGGVYDVAVDIRRNSPTFGRHVRCLITSENWRQIFVPAGFAHGFVTLDPGTEVVYKVSQYWSPEHERGIRWNDPDLGVDWGVDERTAILSERDQRHPLFRETTDLL